MVYTFQISDVSTQSKSLINLLLSLSKDYDFLKVVRENGESELTPDQEEDLDKRYEVFLKNPENGRSWNDIKQSLKQG